MTTELIQKILQDTAYVRTGGSPEELKTAEYIMARCSELGANTHIEPFQVQAAEIHAQQLLADGVEIPCRAYKNCGNADLEVPFLYLPNTDPYSMGQVKGKAVLISTAVTRWVYKDLVEAGAAAIIATCGDACMPDRDIDQKELRPVVSDGTKLPCVCIHVKDAVELVKRETKNIRLVIRQTEGEGESRNVVAELPGIRDEWIIFSAHYDSTSLSLGAYDNMSGCIGLLGILEALAAGAPHQYGCRFLFCGSEERGLLGSKAYTDAHEEDLKKTVLNINLDMVGSFMGKFIAVCTAEQKLPDYISYFAMEQGWGIDATQGVFSSDSTPFADHGVPAISFARAAGPSYGPIHTRYDTMDMLSPKQLLKDIGFLAAFASRMADAACCPVGREIPDNMKKELDRYLLRVRK